MVWYLWSGHYLCSGDTWSQSATALILKSAIITTLGNMSIVIVMYFIRLMTHLILINLHFRQLQNTRSIWQYPSHKDHNIIVTYTETNRNCNGKPFNHVNNKSGRSALPSDNILLCLVSSKLDYDTQNSSPVKVRNNQLKQLLGAFKI